MAGKKAAAKQLKRMADYLQQMVEQGEPQTITLVTGEPWSGDSRFHMPGDGHPDASADYEPVAAGCTEECSEMHTFQPGCEQEVPLDQTFQVPSIDRGTKLHDVRVIGFIQRPGVQLRCNPCAWARHFDNPKVEDLVMFEDLHINGEEA